ncbi:MAG TPA: DUF2510 domain-containing protein [Pseudonocardiaceae bacterium]|nr:DUF2510 domain-containing protein [Pseudonocardiaceae bacterium]
MATPTPPPPGWYPDPEGGPDQRYWNGGRWQSQERSAKHRRLPESATTERPPAWVDQQRAEDELIATKLAHITPPADAVLTSDWEKRNETWSRTFEGPAREIGGIEVGIVGTQRSDGGVTRRVMIREGDAVRLPRLAFDPLPEAGLTTDTARELAEAITQAAENLDRLA